MFVIRKLLTLFLAFFVASAASAIELNDSEKNWLKHHPVIQYAPAPNQPPLEYFDEQKRHRGVTADLLELIKLKTGLSLRISRYSSWRGVMDAARHGKVDLLGSAMSTSGRENYLRYTDALVSLPIKIMMRTDSNFSQATLSQLYGKRIAVVEGYASAQFIQKNYPELSIIQVPDIETALCMVSYHMADAVLSVEAVAIHFIEKNKLFNLKVAGESELLWTMRFASRKDWPALNSIIQKTLDEITDEEKAALFFDDLHQQYNPPVFNEQQIKLFLSSSAILLIFGLLSWSLYQNRKVKFYRDSQAETKAWNHELQQQLQLLRTVDPITGITTQRAWLDEAAKELARYHRYGSSFALMLVEVEGYHFLNIAQGQKGADELGRYIANILIEELREYDLCTELGNGLLGILIQNVDEERTEKVSRRLIAAIAASPGLLIHGKHYHSAIHCSIAVPRAVSNSIDSLMEQAKTKLQDHHGYSKFL